ncbi:hypothetical protein COOONC_26225, partial [Cooperia oncophora]
LVRFFYWLCNHCFQAFDSCVGHIVSEKTTESTLQLLEYIADRFGGIPFLNHTIDDDLDLFKIMGRLEADRALGTFMSSWVSVDYKNVKQNALYISQVGSELFASRG